MNTGSRSYVVRWRVDFVTWTRQAWDAAGAYTRGYVVRHAGTAWAATTDDPAGAPADNNEDWQEQGDVVPAGQVSVIEGGTEFSASNIIEQARERDERRRFLRIEAVGEV